MVCNCNAVTVLLPVSNCLLCRSLMTLITVILTGGVLVQVSMSSKLCVTVTVVEVIFNYLQFSLTAFSQFRDFVDVDD